MDYRTVNLAINLAGRVAAPVNPVDIAGECNPGGSTWCYSPTKGCGGGGATCFGTSTKLESIEAMVSLPAERLAEFQKELAALVARIGGR